MTRAGHCDRSSIESSPHEWLASLQPHGTVADVSALKDSYRARIWTLGSLPNAAGGAREMKGPHYRLDTIARDFDFEIRMLKPCDPKSNDGTCEGAGQAAVFRKGRSSPMQSVQMANLLLSMAENGKPLANSASLYDYQLVVNVGDFNFDGHEDFAIQNGNEGSYGDPSYNVYLCDPAVGRFVDNAVMGDLIQETLDFCQVDKDKKVLRTESKDGCCYHETTCYRVVKNVPVAIAKHTEAISDDGVNMVITDEQLVQGQWQSHRHTEPAPK